ncbi:MAG TPA: ABC transporter ATP-binding protein [Saprospiraceae bacterium]|nr:ABC transporter ATP-binding protein [Saprospiraceae bacterium]
MIEIKNISKRFGKLQALDKLNLTLSQGECVALLGPNGCGKTTLIKSILGMVLPDEGEIIFDGKSIKKDINYRNDIGYMPQIGRYPENMSIGQVLELIRGIRSGQHDTDMELYQQYQIADMLEKKMRTLSGGTTQKVSAVLAFLFRPKVLILDEPTAGLDPIAALILKDKILKAKEEGCLILITSHLLNELEDIVSEIVFMQEGKLILHNSTNELKELTGEDSIARSIVHLLKENGHA